MGPVLDYQTPPEVGRKRVPSAGETFAKGAVLGTFLGWLILTASLSLDDGVPLLIACNLVIAALIVGGVGGGVFHLTLMVRHWLEGMKNAAPTPWTTRLAGVIYALVVAIVPAAVPERIPDQYHHYIISGIAISLFVLPVLAAFVVPLKPKQ